MVLQVLADARQVLDDVHSSSIQDLLIANAGDLEQLGRVESATAEDNLVCSHLARATLPGVLHADGLGALEEDAGGFRAGAELQIRALQGWVQVCASCGETTALVDVRVEGAEALLAVAIDVRGVVVACLLHRLKESLEQRRIGRTALHTQRAVVATARVVLVGAQRIFHALEVRQDMVPTPVFQPLGVAPLVVVHRVAALVDLAVDGGGTADDLAAGVVDATTVHLRFRLGFVLPVVVLVADWEGERRRHVNVEIPEGVHAAGFEYEHLLSVVCGQPVSQHRAGRARANDDDVAVFDCGVAILFTEVEDSRESSHVLVYLRRLCTDVYRNGFQGLR